MRHMLDRCFGVTGAEKPVGFTPCYANSGDAVLQVSTDGLLSLQISSTPRTQMTEEGIFSCPTLVEKIKLKKSLA